MAGFKPFDPNSSGGGGGSSATTYGPLSNANILAIASPSDEETAFSTDDFIVYFFFSGDWYSTAGGILS